MLDINLFCKEKGGDPELIHKLQCYRSASTELVDAIIALDKEWCQRQLELDEIRQKILITKEKEVQLAKSALDSVLIKIGNLVHKTVPFCSDEAKNAVLRTWGEKRFEENLKNHVDLCRMLDIVDIEKGAAGAGGRGYFLKGGWCPPKPGTNKFWFTIPDQTRLRDIANSFFHEKGGYGKMCPVDPV